MILLPLLKPIRIALDMRRSQLARTTLIAEDRLRELELCRAEPWFDEALLISRALCRTRIDQLIGDDWRADRHVVSPFPNDLELWRSGYRAPLSLALRICVRFGVDDPAYLAASPLAYQLWDVVSASERHPEAPGWCPWCAADIIGGDEHLPTCLGHNVFTPHLQRTGVGDADLPKPYKRGRRPLSVPARGLRGLRDAAGLTQAEMATKLGMGSNYYAQLERGDLPLTLQKANHISAVLGVERAVLYARHDEAVHSENASGNLTGSEGEQA